MFQKELKLEKWPLTVHEFCESLLKMPPGTVVLSAKITLGLTEKKKRSKK